MIPTERYQRLKGALTSAHAQLRSFEQLVIELTEDPFIKEPDEVIVRAYAHVEHAQLLIKSADEAIEVLGRRLGVAGRASIGLTVDESAKQSPGSAA